MEFSSALEFTFSIHVSKVLLLSYTKTQLLSPRKSANMLNLLMQNTIPIIVSVVSIILPATFMATTSVYPTASVLLTARAYAKSVGRNILLAFAHFMYPFNVTV